MTSMNRAAARSLTFAGVLFALAFAGSASAGNFEATPTRDIGPYISGQSGTWTPADDRTVGATLTGQDGWTSAPSCVPEKMDQEITWAAAHSGGQSLRISNWYTSTCVDSIVSPFFAAVGESGSATVSGDPAVTNTVTYSFWFRSVSTTPDPGMSFTTQLSALASYRLSFLKFEDGINPDTCPSTGCLHLKTVGIESDDGTPAGSVDFKAHYSPALIRGDWYQVEIGATFNDGPLNDIIQTRVFDSAGTEIWNDISNSWQFGYYSGFFNGHTTNPRPVQGPFAAAHVTFDISKSTGPGPESEYAAAAPHGIYFDDLSIVPGSGAGYSTSFNADRWVATSGTDTTDCSDENAPCETIAYAIDQASNGNTIHIDVGMYSGSVNVNKDGLKLIGEGNGNGDTVLNNTVSISASGAAANPLTIENLRVEGSSSDGIRVTSGSHLLFQDVALVNNNGNGFNFNGDSSDVRIDGGLMDGNTVGLRTSSTSNVDQMAITSTIVSNSRRVGLLLFGAAKGNGSVTNWTIDGSTFEFNDNSDDPANGFGGGIHLISYGGGSVVDGFKVTNSLFADNGVRESSQYKRGGIVVNASEDGVLKNVEICDNTFTETSAPGTQLNGITVYDGTDNSGYEPITVCASNTFNGGDYSITGQQQFDEFGTQPVVNITGGTIADLNHINQLVKNVDTGELFPTITQAINDSDTVDGNTIEVPAGLYQEKVVINKSLTINGAFAGTPGDDVSRTGSGETIIKPASGLAVSVRADGVIFDGFTINGVGTAGLFSGGYADGQVLNNRFMDSNVSGLYIESGSVTSTDWLVRDNLFENLGGTTSTAIRLTNVDGIRVLDNVVRNVSYQGIQLSETTGAEIRGNEISGAQRDGINIAVSSGVVITDNTITDINQADGSGRGAIRLYDNATGIEAYCNIIDAQRGGIALKTGTAGGVHLFDNKVIGNAVSGARFIDNGWSGGR